MGVDEARGLPGVDGARGALERRGAGGLGSDAGLEGDGLPITGRAVGGVDVAMLIHVDDEFVANDGQPVLRLRIADVRVALLILGDPAHDEVRGLEPEHGGEAGQGGADLGVGLGGREAPQRRARRAEPATNHVRDAVLVSANHLGRGQGGERGPHVLGGARAGGGLDGFGVTGGEREREAGSEHPGTHSVIPPDWRRGAAEVGEHEGPSGRQSMESPAMLTAEHRREPGGLTSPSGHPSRTARGPPRPRARSTRAAPCAPASSRSPRQ